MLEQNQSSLLKTHWKVLIIDFKVITCTMHFGQNHTV